MTYSFTAPKPLIIQALTQTFQKTKTHPRPPSDYGQSRAISSISNGRSARSLGNCHRDKEETKDNNIIDHILSTVSPFNPILNYSQSLLIMQDPKITLPKSSSVSKESQFQTQYRNTQPCPTSAQQGKVQFNRERDVWNVSMMFLSPFQSR